MADDIVYKADDRSILLPAYRRFLVDPLLPFIPARVHPNTITHLGHLANLTGTALLVGFFPRHGFLYVLAAITLQFYMWCDNADGSHARRTKQTSVYGEFLDHGLDIVNVIYIGYLSSMAVGASPLQWVVIAVIIPGAGATTYFEQTQTGVFRLGALNQVESLSFLAVILVASAAVGHDFWERTSIFGIISIRDAIVLWLCITVIFGMLRATVRVARLSKSTAPLLALFALFALIVAGAWVHAVSPLAAVSLATAANLFFSTRMLTLRLHGERPKVDWPLVAGALGLLTVLVLHRLAIDVLPPPVGAVVATAGCVLYVGWALLHTRDALQRLALIEAAAAKSGA